MSLTFSVNQAFLKANKFAKYGSLDKAISIYKMIIEKYPNNTRASNALKKINVVSTEAQQKRLIELFNKGLINEAISECQNLIDIYSSDPFLFNFMGVFLGAAGELDKSEEFYLKSLQIDKNSSGTWSNLATVQFNKKLYQQSKNSCDNALQIDPNNPKALTNLGNAFLKLNEEDEALNAFQKALRIEPSSFETLINLSNLYQKSKNYKKAIIILKSALELKKTDKLYYNLASAYRDIGQFNLSIESYLKSLVINNSNRKSLTHLIELLIQLDLFDKFDTTLFDKILEYNQDSSSQALYLTYKIINSYIKNDHTNIHESISKLETIINSEKFSQIKEAQDKKFISAYYIFINGILKKLAKETISRPQDIDNQIYHIGESHCLTFANQRIDKHYIIKPLIIFGLKAWHIGQKKDNRFKSIFLNYLRNLPPKSSLFISIGEIDCRLNEGIISAHQKTGKSIDIIIEQTVEGFYSFIENELSGTQIKRYYFSVPAPMKTPIELTKDDFNQLRVKVVKKFNECLKNKVDMGLAKFVDTYSLTKNSKGQSNKKYMLDAYHMDPKILPLIKDQLI